MENMHNNNGYNGQNFSGNVPEAPQVHIPRPVNPVPVQYADFHDPRTVVVPQPQGYSVRQNQAPAIEEMRITTVSDLHAYGQGKVVKFPDFAEGQPFVARVRRPSMLVLAKEGKIPNTLLNAANELFAGGGSSIDADNPKMLSDLYDVCEVIAEAALMQPTYAEIKQSGIQLSDNQMMALFSYTQNGIKALESFR